MHRRTLLASAAGACAVLAGCSDPGTGGGDDAGDDAPGGTDDGGAADWVDPGPETVWDFENRDPEEWWMARVTFVEQPFERATVTRVDGSETTHEVATVDALASAIDGRRVESIAFEGAESDMREYEIAPNEGYQDVFPAPEGGGAVAIVARRDVREADRHRRVHHFSCHEAGTRMTEFFIEVTANGEVRQSSRGRCAE